MAIADQFAPPVGRIKGDPVRVFAARASAGLSDIAVDCSGVNAASLEVLLLGAGASALLSVEGSPTEQGNYQTLTDPAAAPQTITTAQIIDVLCGAAFLKVRLANVVGAFTVTVIPYISPGPVSVRATVQ